LRAVDALNSEVESLFEAAREDAGLARDDLELVVVDVAPDPMSDTPVRYMPLGAPIQGDELPMTADQAQALRSSRRPHRIAVVGRVESPQLLGLLRWGLETARQNAVLPDVWRFAWTVMDAGVSAAHSDRPGGGVIHSVMPPVRDANLAAARLVSRFHGPQLGKFRGPWGTLFREDKDFGGDETLAARCVIIAAIYRSWIDAKMGDAAITASFVEAAHPDSAGWWEAFITDHTISHVAGVIELMAPTEADLIAVADAPAQAWRPLADLLDRALGYGLGVIGMAEPRNEV